jgi:hypothetical protein
MRALPIFLAAALSMTLPAAPGSAFAQTAPATAAGLELPDTPAGRRAAEIIRLSAEGDDAGTRSYVEANFAPRFRDAFPIEDHVRILGEMRARAGGFDAVEVSASRPDAIQLVVRTRGTNELRMLNVHTEPEPPHRIDGMGMRPLTPADGVETPPVPDHDGSHAGG